MKTTCAIGLSVIIAAAIPAHAVLVNFTYSQGDAVTGSGSIAGFVAGGHTFNALAMPSATVFNPNPGLTPAGFIGAQTVGTGNSNEGNTAVGLLWSGFVTAISTDGYLIDIPLVFVPKQTQAPTDTNDYNWNVAFGDSPGNGVDTVTGASIRFAMYLSRDTLPDALETSDTFQRYTQVNFSFIAGQDSFTNVDTTTAPIKDATDPGGAPTGVDAAGRPLEFYFGWRDQGSVTQGSILIDNFAVGGLLNADDATLRPVPEPGSALLLLAGSALVLRRRRR